MGPIRPGGRHPRRCAGPAARCAPPNSGCARPLRGETRSAPALSHPEPDRRCQHHLGYPDPGAAKSGRHPGRTLGSLSSSTTRPGSPSPAPTSTTRLPKPSFASSSYRAAGSGGWPGRPSARGSAAALSGAAEGLCPGGRGWQAPVFWPVPPGVQPWLDEQNRLWDAELALLAQQQAQLNNMAGIYRALGKRSNLTQAESVGSRWT